MRNANWFWSKNEFFFLMIGMSLLACGHLCPTSANESDANDSENKPEMNSPMENESSLQEVVDCPNSIRETRPSRVVACYIDNRFYRWAEYELSHLNKHVFCIYLLDPEPKPLSRDEALGLLDSQRRVSNQPAQPSVEIERLPADHPSLAREPRTPTVRKPVPKTPPETKGGDALPTHSSSPRRSDGKACDKPNRSGEAPAASAESSPKDE
jgi:hypothetical protein